MTVATNPGRLTERNDFIYPNINNGVYRAGFATTQQAYLLKQNARKRCNG